MSLSSFVRSEAKALWGGGRGKALIAVAVPWGILVGTRMSLPVLLPYIRAEFGLSLTVAGLLVTIIWLAGAIGQLPGGILTDRYSEALLMTVSITLVVIALSFVVLAPNTIILFIAVALWGLGHSLYPIARITILSEMYPERLGSALGLTMATQDIGQTVFPPIAGALAIALVWQAGIGFAIPLLLITGISLWVTVPRPAQKLSTMESLSMDTARYVIDELRRPAMIFMTFILFLFIFQWQAFTTFYPTYLVAEKGISETMASILFGVFFAAGAVVKPIAGMAYDRIGMRWALMAVLAGPTAGLLLLPFLESLYTLLLITLVVSSMLGTGAITQAFLANQFASDMQGTGLGVVRTAAAVFGSAGPVLFGVVADYGFFNEGYLALAVIMAVVIVLTFLMPQPASGNQ